MSLLNELRQWRNTQARIEGVEQYRVLSNTVLESLVGACPQNKNEMLQVKGIKEAKFAKYGAVLLRMLAREENVASPKHGQTEQRRNDDFFQSLLDTPTEEVGVVEETTLSVSEFLDGLNIELSGMAARIRGEVSSVDVRERVVYFTIKDSRDESTLSCLIFRNQYTLSGVDLALGDEVIVEGAPDIYKPNGRLSLKVGVIELCGEGALKKAYDALKLKLEEEGVFAPERKRALPKFPTRIALITSEQGAAIGDFTMNLGSQGFRVGFYPTSVEGKKAVYEILEALHYFTGQAKEYDLLVVIRGGGSLESLQAFNNEALVRAIAECPIPTLVGVGHEKDITLAALAADTMVSTPTATARTLREPWDEARGLMHHFEQQLPLYMERELSRVRTDVGAASESLIVQLGTFLQYATALKQSLVERVFSVQALVRQKISVLDQVEARIEQRFVAGFERSRKELLYAEDLLRQYDPTRVLRLGYSLVKRGKEIIKDVSGLRVGDILDIQLSRGKVKAKLEKIILEEGNQHAKS
ncbi:MAG: exodeoxyribonuclease VII large subunit [Candidatus Moranbacteria bacterium]|jgi:exodeoxyribonuclease VII large subunit|nr:exodeoxyribonuclease VII large subunit [Candidatus Moranbacteria bacterium]